MFPQATARNFWPLKLHGTALSSVLEIIYETGRSGWILGEKSLKLDLNQTHWALKSHWRHFRWIDVITLTLQLKYLKLGMSAYRMQGVVLRYLMCSGWSNSTSTAETLTWTSTLKLSVVGGGGEPEEFKSFTRCQHESSAHKGPLHCYPISCSCHVICHMTGSTFRMLAQKAETEKLGLVAWNWFW